MGEILFVDWHINMNWRIKSENFSMTESKSDCFDNRVVC